MKVTGKNEFQEQPIVDRWTAKNGPTMVRTWRGPKSALETFLTENLPAGFTELEKVYRTQNTNCICEVKATYATDSISGGTNPPSTDPFTTTWSLQGREVLKHILTHPKTYALAVRDKSWPAKCEAQAKKWRLQLKRGAETGVSVTIPDGFAIAGIQNNPTQAEIDWAYNLMINLMNNPDEMYEAPEYTLKKTQVVSHYSQIVVSNLYVGWVLSSAALATSEPTLTTPPYAPGVPLLGWTNLNTLLWHKKTPTVNEVAKGRYELTQTYLGVTGYNTYSYQYLAEWPTN